MRVVRLSAEEIQYLRACTQTGSAYVAAWVKPGRPSVCPFACRSVCLSVGRSVCLSVGRSVRELRVRSPFSLFVCVHVRVCGCVLVSFYYECDLHVFLDESQKCRETDSSIGPENSFIPY